MCPFHCAPSQGVKYRTWYTLFAFSCNRTLGHIEFGIRPLMCNAVQAILRSLKVNVSHGKVLAGELPCPCRPVGSRQSSDKSSFPAPDNTFRPHTFNFHVRLTYLSVGKGSACSCLDALLVPKAGTARHQARDKGSERCPARGLGGRPTRHAELCPSPVPSLFITR